MKHTTRKILALLLVLTMVIGMVPLAVLTIGALEDQSVSFVPAESGESAPEFTLDIRACEPTISLKDATGVLNFWTAVSKAGYNEIADALAYGAMGDATLTFGTLITTQSDYIAMNGELTHATAGTNAEDVAFDMVFNAAGDPVWCKEDADGFGYIVASKVIAAGDHATDYVAVGYAKLTIDGDVYYAYASNANETGTSLYELAIRALNDVSDERDEDYKFQIANDLYAANTVKQRKEMMPFITNVIEVKTAGDAINGASAAIELVTYDKYNPIYDPAVTVDIQSIDQATAGDVLWAQLLGMANTNGYEPDEIDVIYAVIVDAAAGASLEDLNLVLDGMKVAEESLVEVNGENCYLFGLSNYAG